MAPRATAPARQRLAAAVRDHMASMANPEKAAQAVWRNVQHDGVDVLTGEITDVCTRLILADKDTVGVEKGMDFIQLLARHIPAEPPALADACMNCLEGVLSALSELTCLKDLLQRRRCLALVHGVLTGVEKAGVGLSEEVAEVLVQQLSDRLDDKAAGVRCIAAQALSHLTSVDEQETLRMDDPALLKLLARLEDDTNKAVRFSIMAALTLDGNTLRVFARRMRDEDPDVRAMVCKRLVNAPCTAFTHAERLRLLQTGLQDRCAPVREAAAGLCRAWLDLCKGDVIKLLEDLAVERCPPGLLDLVMDALVQSGALDLAELLAGPGGDAPAGSSLRTPAEQLHDGSALFRPAVAFVKRYACVRLYGQATERGQAAAATMGAAATMVAADATRLHDALEAALPESAEQMVAVLQQAVHLGPHCWFAAMQLLHLATTCMDWADGPSRAAGMRLLTVSLIPLDPRLERRAQPPLVAPLLAGGGGAREWEAAVMRLASRLLPGGAELLQAVLQCLRHAAEAWGLCPDAATDGDGAQGPGADADADGSLRVQAMVYVELAVLQALPDAAPLLLPGGGGQGGQQAHWVLRDLLWPAVESPLAHVRAAALRTLGLLALLPTRASILPGVCGAARAALSPEAAAAAAAPAGAGVVRAQAVRTLCDLMLACGVGEVTWAAWAGPAVRCLGQPPWGGAAVDALAAKLAGAALSGGGGEEREGRDVARGRVDQDVRGVAGPEGGAAGRDLVGCLVQLLEDVLGRAAAATAEAAAEEQEDEEEDGCEEEEEDSDDDAADVRKRKAKKKGGKGSSKGRASSAKGASKAPPKGAAPAGAVGEPLDAQVVLSLAEGLARLLMYQDTHRKLAGVRRLGGGGGALALTASQAGLALRQLLCCHVHPAMAAAPEAQQCLVVFWQRYSSSVPAYRVLLACAAVPAARQALHITLPGLRKTAAPQVLQWVRQLLLACPSPAAAGAASQAPGGDATQAAAEEEDGDGSAGLGWEECLALGCALELGALLRAYAGQLEAGRAAPQDGWEDLAKELAALLMSVPLKPELHAATIQACSAQLRPWCEPGALSELPARAAAGGGAQRGKGGKTKKRAVRKLPVALVRALAAAHAHVEGLAGEAAGRQVPQEAVEELTARAAKLMLAELAEAEVVGEGEGEGGAEAVASAHKGVTPVRAAGSVAAASPASSQRRSTRSSTAAAAAARASPAGSVGGGGVGAAELLLAPVLVEEEEGDGAEGAGSLEEDVDEEDDFESAQEDDEEGEEEA